MSDAPLSEAQLERYARHIFLPEIGGAGQVKLGRSRVLLVGAGGLGSPAALYLAAAGTGTVVLVDDDEVSLANLQRQVLHTTDRIGTPKTESARTTLLAINPEINVETITQRVSNENAESLVHDCTAVLDGSDNFTTRGIVNAACVDQRVPLISGAISAWDGTVSVFRPWLGTPCWRCIYPAEPGEGDARTCAEVGVLGALAGIIGALMAAECVKLITGAGELLERRLLLYDSLAGEFRVVAARARNDCTVCSSVPKDRVVAQ